MVTEGKNEQNEKPQGLEQESKEKDSKTSGPTSSGSDEEQIARTSEAISPPESIPESSGNENEPLKGEEQPAIPDVEKNEAQPPEIPSEVKEQVAEEASPVPETQSESTETVDNTEVPVAETIEQADKTSLEDDSKISDTEEKAPEAEIQNTESPTGKVNEPEADETKPVVDTQGESPELKEHPQEASEHEETGLEETLLDYSRYNKKQLVQVLESLLKSSDMSQVGKILKEVKRVFDGLHTSEREKAFEKYLEEGGEKDGFEYKEDELDHRFRKSYGVLRERRHKFFNSLDKQREDNLKAKQELLERLRQIVDSKETTASIADLKKIEKDWREIGPVAPQHARSLWASFHALRNRYYDHRSIYFELKELDRRKNQKQKLQLIEKAEQLDNLENIKDAIHELNELHEEFKLVGPVPAEEQEPLWQRFKAASDKIYAKRKHFYEELKEKFKLNLIAKHALIEKIQEFEKFESDRIVEWNAKTKELLALQKEWESIGGLPKDRAKKINKAFWSSFKTFFNRKGHFFRKLEESRKENLEKKEALLEKARELKDKDDFDKTAEAFKILQKQWREIGPVPEKYKDKVYKEFKEACDNFFNRRRQHLEQVESSYEGNLKKKIALCEELEQMREGKINLDRVTEIQDLWGKIGYVPRNSMKSIQKKFLNAVNSLADRAEIADDEKHILKFKARFSKMNYGPNADKFLQKKENALRRQITKLENDINLWRNNLDFFAKSRTADKLKIEFNKKIDSAEEELIELKNQLKVLNRI